MPNPPLPAKPIRHVSDGPYTHADDLVYTAQEVEEISKNNRNSVRLATVNGELPHRQLGDSVRSIRHTREDIDTLLALRARRGPLQPAADSPRLLPAPRIQKRGY